MVLGTLVAFIFVGIGAFRLKLVNPLVSIVSALGCLLLAFKLGEMVLKVYCVTLPVGLIIYFLYGYKHSKLAAANRAKAAVSELTSARE
jgi:APA family basic amino acid/polyamine antiporter